MQRAFRLEPKTWKLIALAALVAAAAIGFWPYLAPALRLLLGGGAIAFLLDPLCQRLCVRLKRPLAAGVAILGVAAALIGLVLLLAPFMVWQVGALADAIPSSVAAVRALVERVEGFFRNKGIALGSLAANLERGFWPVERRARQRSGIFWQSRRGHFQLWHDGGAGIFFLGR